MSTSRTAACQRLLLTPGEPAGIGPDLTIMLAQQQQNFDCVAIADPKLLRERAEQLQLPLSVHVVDPQHLAEPQPSPAGQLSCLPVGLAAPAIAGRLDPANAHYVLQCLDTAIDLCLARQAHAMVTGPVQKSTINAAGIAFSGHTEYLAEHCQTKLPLMLLATPGLRVALATTHLPLHQVPALITDERLESILRILHSGLQQQFGIAQPRILVSGLNPHAGEHGHLGREEIEIITPLLERLRNEGMQLQGPLPADTLFTPKYLENADAVLAMYHDQGLPVLKHMGFGKAVNVTLGLPILRTSVDHGTALDLAGTGKADAGSLRFALETALELQPPGLSV